MGRLEIPVVGGMCILLIQSPCATGRESDTNPGVGFELISEEPAISGSHGKFYSGMGVIGRRDLRKLRDLLIDFLEEYP